MFDDFDTEISCEEYEDAMEGFEQWQDEMLIMDVLVNDDQWEDYL